MTDQRIVHQHHATFEGIRHTDAEGNEFWLARPLAKGLDYSEYRHFLPVLERAREACRNSEQEIADHFEDVLAMVEIGSGARRELPDVRLSSYACYLIVQNGDPGKPLMVRQAHHERERQAHHEPGKTYFAMQTRRSSYTVRPELVEGGVFARLGKFPFVVSLSNHSPCIGTALRQAQGERVCAQGERNVTHLSWSHT